MTHLPSHPEAMIYREFARAFPEPLDALDDFTQRVLYGEGPLSLGERELIASYVGALSGCDYVHQSHRHAALAHGMVKDVVDRVVGTSREGELENRKLVAALELVRHLTVDPGSCDAASVAAVLDAGHDEAALRQIVYLAGYWAMIVRIVDGLGISGDNDYHTRMGQQLAKEARQIQAELAAGQ